MSDVMSFFDSRWMQAFDLVDKDGRPKDFTLAIERVEGGELTLAGGAKTRKPVLFFRGAKKGLALNKTNAKTLIGMYGREATKWVGKLATIYPTTTPFGRDPAVPCIRIRPTIPRLGAGPGPAERAPDVAELERKAAAAEST